VTAYTRDARGLPLTATRGSGTPGAVTTTYTWHPTLRVPTKVQEPGLTTDFVWTSGKLTSATQTDTTSHSVPYSTNGQTRVWTFGYSGALLTSVNGPLPGAADTTTYAYGTDGYLRTVTNPLGQVTTVNAVNGRGQPTSITDPNGVATTIAYDGMGHVTGVTADVSGTPSTTTFTYDANWNVASITRPGGTALTFAWDNASRLTGVSNALGESIAYTLDDLGNQKKIVVKKGATITAQRTQAFDELGRLIRTIKGDASAEWSFGYDKTGNQVRVTDPRSQSWASGFDALNRLVSQTDPESATVTLTRNGTDDVTTYKDPRNLSTTYVRNGFGDVIREASPDAGTTDFVYDQRGLVAQKTKPGGEVETFAYDAAGRLIGRAFSGGAAGDMTFTWDGVAGGNKGKGRITRVDDRAGYSAFQYDARGNVLSEARTIAGTTYTVSYAYDLADRLTQITYPSGRIVTYGRDAMGRVTSVASRASAGANLVTLASNISWLPMAGTEAALSPPSFPDLAFGLAARNSSPVTDGLGMNAGTAAQVNPLPGTEVLTSDIVQSLSYGNGFGLFKNFTQDNAPYQALVEGGGSTALNRGLGSSDGVNVTQMWDALEPSETQDFTYSNAGRLASASGAYGTRAWTYDGVGNRLTESKDGVAASWTYPTTSNRLASVTQGSATLRSFAYDTDGTVASDTRGADVFAYMIRRESGLGSVKKNGVEQASYVNDAYGRLRIRTVAAGATPLGTTHVAWDVFGHVLSETLTGTGVQREYVWLGDMPLAVFDATSGTSRTYYVHVDHLDRPVMMTNASKTVVWKASYEPFGAVREITGAAALDLRFPGQWFQLESGLAYNWNRHYDPTLGRYIQPDPLGFVDGPSIYGYAGQSPLMRVDPTGWITAGSDAPKRPTSNFVCVGDSTKDDCIARCSVITLPTKDYGITFQRCLAHCMGKAYWPQFKKYFP
jgi:RHS repeat-associated protein